MWTIQARVIESLSFRDALTLSDLSEFSRLVALRAGMMALCGQNNSLAG